MFHRNVFVDDRIFLERKTYPNAYSKNKPRISQWPALQNQTKIKRTQVESHMRQLPKINK